MDQTKPILLSRVQFMNTVDHPSFNRTIVIDDANKQLTTGMVISFDGQFVRVEKPKEPDFRALVVPLSNVAAMFPKIEEVKRAETPPVTDKPPASAPGTTRRL